MVWWEGRSRGRSSLHLSMGISTVTKPKLPPLYVSTQTSEILTLEAGCMFFFPTTPLTLVWVPSPP